MTGKLPINIDHLLRQRTIEGERVEYKAGWNPQSVRQNGSPEPIFESDENRTWFLVRLPVHERAYLAATDQDTIHDTQQDKSLKNKEKGQDTPQDTPQDTVHETIHETIHVTEHVERLISILTGEMNPRPTSFSTTKANRNVKTTQCDSYRRRRHGLWRFRRF